MSYTGSGLKDVIKSLGIVFGDIGTSPIYTLSAIFALLPVTISNVMGILSLIIWTLTLLVSFQYAWLAMSLGSHGDGEGGTLVLKRMLIPLIKSKKVNLFFTSLAFLGISFFIGDGTITPAISILSAVEGLKLIPFLQGLNQNVVIAVAIFITFLLFFVQKRGVEKISLAFGPIMVVWFTFLSISGLLFIVKYPYIFACINPYYAISFLKSSGFIGILLLSKVILCATGAEALYADMGHLGRKPIIKAWIIVFVAMCLIYLGQGVFLIENPKAQNVFYEMAFNQFSMIYIPILILSVTATAIASQAMISGLFSVIYQGITTNIFPRLYVEYTSQKMASQIYIPCVNWFLLFFVILTMMNFQTSQNLANAYGLAVSSSMTITSILLATVFILKRNALKIIISTFLVFVNFLFLFSNMFKISSGGYWSLITASIPLFFIIVYTLGQKKLYRSLRQMPLDLFVEKFEILSPKIPHINGTAVFLSKTVDPMPAYMTYTIFTNNILYEDNIVVTVETQKTPFGVTALFKKDLAPGLRVFEIKVGYLEILNLEKVFNAADIHPKVIFYGLEDISTRNLFWYVYMLIKKLTSSFVQFYKLPTNKLHGVVVRVEL